MIVLLKAEVHGGGVQVEIAANNQPRISNNAKVSKKWMGSSSLGAFFLVKFKCEDEGTIPECLM